MACRGGSESSSSSHTSNLTPKWKYEVFLSFAGKDTRLKFTNHLDEAFKTSGIKTFRDDVDLERGRNIMQNLFQAIEDSLCSVVVISKTYANSKWCLDELKKILESQETLHRRVFPIFYDVDPADVRKQPKSSTFGKAMATHEKKIGKNSTIVQNWRTALSAISHLSGWDTRGKEEADLIKDIVGEVWTYLSSKLPSHDDNLVGINSRVADIISILDIGLDDKHFVGIWGMGGVGKTTLARDVFEKLSYKFEVCCFLVNVRETLLERDGLVSLQEKLLSHLKIPSREICDHYEGKLKIKRFLCNTKVLLVLDDLDNVSQLEYLAQSPNWFGKGSKIIITTRDKHLLTSCGVDRQRIFELKVMNRYDSLQLFLSKAFKDDHTTQNCLELSKYGGLDVQRIYEMEIMNKYESLQLLLSKAFKDDNPKRNYLELSIYVVEYVGCLPLALKVLGSFLCGRSIAEWRDALDRLKNNPDTSILQVLQISYDGLIEEEKRIFLDVACFFNHWKKNMVTQILKICNLHPTIGINVLIEKTLLVETEDGKLHMHDLLEEFGRHLVCRGSHNNVGKRSRLWEFEDIKQVLENNLGSEEIEAIVLPIKPSGILGEIKVHPEAFSNMRNIRLLLLDIKWIYHIVVRWSSRARPDPLVEQIVIHYSGKQLWNGNPLMDKLKFIHITGPHKFSMTPDFSRVRFLEHLRISSCPSLVEVHSSLGKLEKLAHVYLDHCVNLKILPNKLETNSLMKFDLSYCENVTVLPEFGEGMKKLLYLDVSNTAITTLPESLGYLTGLRHLNWTCCKVSCIVKELKTCITCEIASLHVTSLTELCLRSCGLNDGSIPDDFGCLSSLIAFDLSYNDFVNLPTGCFSRLSQLVFLSLDHCHKLKSLPRLPPRLIRLGASHCDLMEPLSDIQSWNLVASLNHEYRGWTKYVISSEEYDDVPLVAKPDEPKCRLPLRDFCAIISGCKIPSWFPNEEYLKLDYGRREYVIKVNIPPSLRDSEWSGLVLCFSISPHCASSMFSWSAKAAEDGDYICKEWAHYVHRSVLDRKGCSCIMVLELNEETCWQHLRPSNNTLHIKFVGPFSRYLRGCGWRVICKTEIQKWCNDNDFSQLTQSQLASPHVEINLTSTVFKKFIRKESEEDTEESDGDTEESDGDTEESEEDPEESEGVNDRILFQYTLESEEE